MANNIKLFAFFILAKVVSPQNVTRNVGGEFSKVVGGVDTDCTFIIPVPSIQFTETINPNSSVQPHPDDPERIAAHWTFTLSGSPECGIQVSNLVSNDHGYWKGTSTGVPNDIFFVFIQEAPSKVFMENQSQNLTIEVKEPGVTVQKVDCTANNARPAPEVKWFIGDDELKNVSRTTKRLDNDFVDVTDEVSFFPLPKHDGKLLKCVYYHPANNESNPNAYEASRFVIVHSLPDNESLAVEYPQEFVIGQSASVQLRLHSNPLPDSVQWKMHDLSEVVEVNIDQSFRILSKSIVAGRYTFDNITNDGYIITAKFSVDKLMESDIGPENLLFVTNKVGNTTFAFKLENAQTVGLSSGAVAGIVIGVILVLALLGGGGYVLMKKKRKNKAKKSRNFSPQVQIGPMPSSVTMTRDAGMDNDATEMQEKTIE